MSVRNNDLASTNHGSVEIPTDSYNSLKNAVCPHAGGVGLCEMVQHLQAWDFVSVSGSSSGRLVEYVDQQHEHFHDPCRVERARYLTPQLPGYSTQFLTETLEKFSYPHGTEWKRMFEEGIFPKPDETELVNG